MLARALSHRPDCSFHSPMALQTPFLFLAMCMHGRVPPPASLPNKARSQSNVSVAGIDLRAGGLVLEDPEWDWLREF